MLINGLHPRIIDSLDIKLLNKSFNVALAIPGLYDCACTIYAKRSTFFFDNTIITTY